MKLRVVLVAGLASLAAPAGAQDVTAMKLAAAAQDCRADEVAALLAGGADPNGRNSAGYTPLMLAAGNGCEPVVRLLLARGADRGLSHPSFGDAAAQARMNGNRGLAELIAAGPVPVAAAAGPQAAATVPAARQPPADTTAAAGGRDWPKLGRYRPGASVLWSGTAGKTWQRGTVKSIDPTYGYDVEGVTGSNDAYFVAGTEREPFWTRWFVGDWKVSVPMATGTVTDGRYVYRTVTGGMRLPPLRIRADGSYSWRVQSGKGERLIQGRWDPNPDGPGVILRKAEQGADWIVYNNSRTGSTLGETIIVASDCCSHYDGSRLD